jgi:hypothetical protein
MSRKNLPTMFSHDAEVGVKCMLNSGCLASQSRTAGFLCVVPERRTVMQSWADYLDQLREGRIVQKPFVDPHQSPDVTPSGSVGGPNTK